MYTYCHTLSLPAALPIARWLRRPLPNRDQKRGERSRSARHVRYVAGRNSNGGPMTITGSLARAARALVQLPRDHVARLAALDASVLADFEAGRAELDDGAKIGRAHVCTPVTNAQLVGRLLLE